MQTAECKFINNNIKIIDDTFILKSETKNLRFIHLTYEENIQSIKKNGFYKGEGLFGEGLYVCNLEDEESIKSLINFSSDLIEDRHDELAVVEGIYNGKYHTCIDTEKHFEYAIGFILIEDVEKININNISIIEQRLLRGYLMNLNKNLLLCTV